jgi:Glycosyl transferases group 1
LGPIARPPERRVLFHRDFARFSGGHLKVRDYFDHVASSPGFVAEVFVTPSSLPDHPWRDSGPRARYEPEKADILFVAGMDWLALDPYPGIEEATPVVNLLQHVRHASPRDARYRFLARRATRICVGPEVAEAVAGTGRCNGPIHVIPNGIDATRLPARKVSDTDVFIAGLKRPGLALSLAGALQAKDVSVDCQTGRIPRAQFLDRMARAEIAVTLPRPNEGFFLPALEAMFIGCAVVCPDCVGNRSFCRHGSSCLMPEPEVAPLAEAVMTLIARPDLRDSLIAGGLAMSRRHGLAQERSAFLEVLKGIA